MTTEILAACSPGEVRVAVRGPDGLLDYGIWRPGAPDGVGDLHRGRVIARVPAMAGAFVALVDSEGFLPDSAGAAVLTAGDHVGVRVVRAAQGGKGPRLAADPDPLAADGPVRLIRRGPGAVERLALRYPDATVSIDDAAVAAALRTALSDRLRVVRAAFDDEIESEAAALGEPSYALPGGAAMHVSPTPALTAIDLDLGSATSARASKTAAQLAANIALIPALARQIRLRELGGAILIDFGGLASRRRPALRPALEAALATDPMTPRCLGFTVLGLAEIVRPRVHPPLHELLRGPHAAALAALRACEDASRANPGRTPRLIAAPSLVAALELDAVALADFARRTGHSLALTADPALGAAAAPPWRCAWSGA